MPLTLLCLTASLAPGATSVSLDDLKLAPAGSPAATSGATKPAVPAITTSTRGERAAQAATPRSASLTSPPAVRSTLPGQTSRWMTAAGASACR